MKKEIHPKYFEDIVITCSCGATYEVGSTKEAVKIEICSACHPFYSGQAKLVDTAGRVDRFRTMLEKSQAKKAANAPKKERVKENK